MTEEYQGSVDYTQEQATARLRFVVRSGQRILQQGWTVTGYKKGHAVSQTLAWRDVPLETE